MANKYRKPRVRVGSHNGSAIGVFGEGALSASANPNHGPGPTQRRASKRKKSYTPAEKRLEQILNSLGGGALRGKFYREWAYGRWIVDFFFWENRRPMGIDQRTRMTRLLALILVLAIAPSQARAVDSEGSNIPAPLWSAQPTTSINVQERTFKNGTVNLRGTLYTPQVKSRVPAVIVFHAASSPTRDFPLYRHLVEMLPPLKVAVFVFDRRGSGKSGGKLEDTDYAMLADDGIAAQRMLADDPLIDPRRIGFWGLSQGGWLSLLAASRSSQTAFAISISAPMTTPDVQMNFLVANVLRIKGFPWADIDQAVAARTAVDDFMRGNRDRPSTQAILDAAAAEPWFEHAYVGKTFKDPDQSRWAKEMRHDPLVTLDAVKVPALVIYGSADPVVPVQTSVERLRASAARHPHIEVAVIAGADHAMATSVSAADQIDPVLSAKEAPQSPEYFGLLGAWLAKQEIARVP